jgi:aminocarboxymuconate-semialdehyde decarboxylase
LPQTGIDAMLEETDRAIQDLGFRGVQLTTNIQGKALDLPEFLPLRETIRSTERMGIPDSDKEKIFEHNAKTLLRLPE